MAKTQVKLKQIQRQALSPLQKLSGELLELPSEALDERIEKENEARMVDTAIAKKPSGDEKDDQDVIDENR